MAERTAFQVPGIAQRGRLKLARAAAWGLLALALTVLAGWHLQSAPLVQVNAAFLPLQYHAALGFLLAATGWLLFGHAPGHWRTGVALLLLALGLATLLQHLSGASLGLDPLFMQPAISPEAVSPEAASPGRMAPNTALCFSLTGLALLLASEQPGLARCYGWSAVSAVILGLALVALVGYASGLPPASGWGGLTPMALPAAAGCLVLGLISLACVYLYPCRQASDVALGLSWSLPLGASSLLLLFQALQADASLRILTATGAAMIMTLACLLVVSVIAMQHMYLNTRAVLQRSRYFEHQVRSTLDAMLDCVIVIDGQGIIQDVNAATLSCFGYDGREDLVGHNVKMLMPEEHARAHDGYLAHYRATGEERIIGLPRALQAQRRDGSRFPMKLLVTPSSFGTEKRFTGVIHDLTEMHNLQQEKADAQDLFTASVDVSPVGFVIVDEFLRVSFSNDAASRWFGGATLIGKSLVDFLEGDDKEDFSQLLQQLMASPAAQSDTFEMHCVIDGRPRHYSACITVLSDSAGRRKLSMQLLDITERVALERELTNRNEQLIDVNKELDRFAYVASHDLKSPVNAIKKLSSWIVKDCEALLPPESQEHLQLLQSRSDRISRLLDDLLAYSRLGRLNSALESVRLPDLVRGIIDTLGVEDRVRLDLDDALIKVPRVPVEMVIRNLIDNAVKHHSRERVALRVWVQEQTRHYRIYVQDDGDGIAPEYAGKIFELFTTLRPRDETEGSGMGLAVCRKLVESYGGTIDLVADQRPGACFLVAWPKPLSGAGRVGQKEVESL